MKKLRAVTCLSVVLGVLAPYSLQTTSQAQVTAKTRTAPPAAPASGKLTADSFAARGLTNGELLKDFYLGAFEKIDFDRDSQLFGDVMNDYLYGFSESCQLPVNKRVELTHEDCTNWSPQVVNQRTGAIITPSRCLNSTTVHDGWADPGLMDAANAIKKNDPLHDLRGVAAVMKDPGGSLSQMVVNAASLAPDMKAAIKMNGCGSAALARFQENLRLFALNDQPLRIDGTGPVMDGSKMARIYKDSDYAKLLDDLLVDQSKSWSLSTYRKNSIKLDGVRFANDGKPYEVNAAYKADGYSGYYDRTVRLDFEAGSPKCLYFSDVPDTCRTPNRRIAAAFLSGSYYSESRPNVPATPAKAMVDVFPERGRGIDIAVLNTILTPGPGQMQKPQGEVASDIAGSSSGAGAIIAIPKGSKAQLTVLPYTGGINISLVSVTLADGTVLPFKNQTRTFPRQAPASAPKIPTPGSGEYLHFDIPLNTHYTMPQTDFERKKAEYSSSLGVSVPVPGDQGKKRGPGGASAPNANANIAPDDFRNRRIYAKSTLFVYAMQDVDLDTAKAGTMIRAQTRDDLTDFNEASHPDRVHISKGTDVYLKIIATPDATRPFVDVTITADHLVSHGMDVPLTAKPYVARQVASQKTGPDAPRMPPAQSPVYTKQALAVICKTKPSTPGCPGAPTSNVAYQQAVMATYQNMRVVKAGALILIETTADTFVRDGTPAGAAEVSP